MVIVLEVCYQPGTEAWLLAADEVERREVRSVEDMRRLLTDRAGSLTERQYYGLGLVTAVLAFFEYFSRYRPDQIGKVFDALGQLGPSSDDDRRAIMGYHLEVLMTDMLIRDVPDDVVAAVDARASRLGLSRSEYVRRRLAQDAASAAAVVSTEDLSRFSELFGDLGDPDVMSQAWR